MGVARVAAMVVAAGLTSGLAAPAHAAPVRTGRAACAVAKARVAASLHRPRARVPYCETLKAVDSPRGFYIARLSGRCREDICGSTLIGWYAVRKRDGRVFAWNVGDWELGAPIH